MSYLISTNSVSETLSNLSDKKIFFAHQSVGFNIIDGIKDLMKSSSVKLSIVELKKIHPLTESGFYHARVGKNGDPFSKIDDFAKQIDAGIGGTADIAFLKFCFVDIRSQTDIQKVLNYYIQVMEKLEEKYPQTKFVHLTVPLSTTITTWKTRIKILMGKKDIWEYDSNIRKNEYNRMLKNHYAGKEPVFDLAAYESKLPDGRRSKFTKDGKDYFDLASEYAHDEGHLNEKGRKWIAKQFLYFLSELNL